MVLALVSGGNRFKTFETPLDTVSQSLIKAYDYATVVYALVRTVMFFIGFCKEICCYNSYLIN